MRCPLVLLHLLAPEWHGLEAGHGGRERHRPVEPHRLLHVPDELLLEVEEARLLLAEEGLELLLVAGGELLDVVELATHDGAVAEVIAVPAQASLDAVADADVAGEIGGLVAYVEDVPY